MEDADGLNRQGALALQRAMPGLAAQFLRRAIVAAPECQELYNNLGLACLHLGLFAEAQRNLCKALTLHPEAAECLANLGRVFHLRKQGLAARHYCHAALALRPDLAEAQHHLGMALDGSDDSVGAFRRAILIEPGFTAPMHDLALLLAKRQAWQKAISLYRRALAFAPSAPFLWNDLGVAYRNDGGPVEARLSYRRALALKPDLTDSLYNLALAESGLGQWREAERFYRAALATTPDHAKAHANLACLLLARGAYRQGWREFEWRWQAATMRPRHFSAPQWYGEPAPGKRLLIHAEQGFGDTLQFCRFIAPVIRLGIDVVLEVPQDLMRLMRRLPGIAQVIAAGDPLPAFDLHCPMMSLPLALGIEQDSLPLATSYLRADPARSADWRQFLAAPGKRLIGLSWAGRSRTQSAELNAIDRRRSLDPKRLAPLWSLSDRFHFVSLQKEAASPGLPIADPMGEIGDFADCADLVSALDLVIAVDSAVAHLAGGLGKPVWLLNRHDSCWRWGRERSDTPWYPSLRQFRQTAPGDWDSVIAEIAMTLDLNAI